MFGNVQDSDDDNDDMTAIRRWFSKYIANVFEEDQDTYLASWSDDVIFHRPDQRALVGKAP